MKITRIQAGRKAVLTVSLSYVLNELSSAQFSGIIRRIQRDDLTITVTTRRGIRVSYTFPAELEYLLGWLSRVDTRETFTRMAQVLWLAFFAGITDLTDEYVINEGSSRVVKALLSRIDKVLGHENTLDYHEALALLPA